MSQAKYYNGKTIKEWSLECGLEAKTIKSRLKEGWTIEDAVTIPYGEKRPTEKSLYQIALEHKMSHKTLKKRLNDGMSLKDALAYSNKKSYVGNRYGILNVEKEVEQKRDPNGRARRQMLCLCDCGNYTIATIDSLSSGNVQSCGCLRRKMLSQKREKNLTGMTVGRWHIEGEAFRDKFGIHWDALCECGNRGTPTTHSLLAGISTSCGCYSREQTSERERIDLTGQKIFKLTVKERAGKDQYNNCLWLCICECGRTVITTTARLLGGQIISCGCERSKGECIIEDLLSNDKILFVRNAHFNDLKLKTYLYFDFMLFDKQNNKHLIEYQGLQHYIDRGKFGKQQREVTDSMKREYCAAHNIPLYEIRYDEDIPTRINEIIAHVNPVLSE